jgi:Zn finger protein HypA/HybF involved in hydrogenase expression
MPDQIPCPDCGSPVRPDSEQLCPNCGYPLMFLRRGGGDAQVRAVPRSPGEVAPPPVPAQRSDTRQFAAVAAPGQVRCRVCDYPNEAARFRCERCGEELRPSRPQARVLAPPPPTAPAPRAGGWWWLIALLVLAAFALIALAVTVAWRFLG